MATDPFIKMAEELEADMAARRQAATTGQTNTIIPGDPGATVTTETEMPPVYPNTPGGTPVPQHKIAMPITTIPAKERGVEATIPDSTRDPFIVMAEKLEAEAENKAREPDFTAPGSNPGFIGRSFARMASGFNAVIADTIGNTAEWVDESIRPLGASIFSNPKTAKKQVHDWMNKQGMATARISGAAGAIGSAAPEGLVMAAAWLSLAPAMAAKAGSTVVGRWIKGYGEIIQKYPGLLVAQEIGSVVGARVGAEQAADRGMGQTPQLLSAFGGAVIGGSMANVVRSGARGLGHMVGIGRSRDAFVPKGSLPIREAVDPETAKIVGERMVAGERVALELNIRNTIDSAANLSLRDPGMASAQVVNRLDEASEMGRAMERVAWAQTRHAKAVMTPTDEVHDLFTTLRVEAAAHNRSDTIPTAIMQRFEHQNTAPAVPARPTGVLGPGGTPIMTPGSPAAPRPTTIGRLLGFHADVVKAMAHERLAPARGLSINSELIRTLARIDERVLDVIQRTLPLDTTIAAARLMSSSYNEMFTQGVVAQIRGLVGRNEAITPPAMAVQKILKEFGGADQIARIGNEIPVVGGTVRAEFEQAVRSEFRKVAQTLGPNGATDFMGSIEPSIRNLAVLRGDLMQAADDLVDLTKARKTLDGSALAKFSAKDSEAGIRTLFSDPKSPTEARAIMATLGRDADAVQAFRTGVIDHLVRNSSGFPSKIEDQLKNPRIARTLAEIFTPAQNARFSRLVTFGARIERGDETLLQKFRRGGLPVIGALMGAQTGRTMTKFLGMGATIQVPGIIAGVSRNWFRDLFAGVPLPELMARAVLDPRWERMLMQRLPETTKQQRNYIRGLKLMIRLENAAITTEWGDRED